MWKDILTFFGGGKKVDRCKGRFTVCDSKSQCK